ncbi:MAG TPA: response regulator [Treponemataceae bacterium]|nr:response regulator [Treponemataceae bacterium]
MFSALEVANLCGVVNQTAINWIKNGHLKAFNTPGGQYRIYRDDLVSFVIERGMRIPEELQNDVNPGANWKTVLIVDDDIALNNAIKTYLQKNLSNMNILQSFDGFDAGAQLVEKKPGFVILDIALPGVDGQEICKRIKTDPAFGKPYVIIITALEDPSLEDEFIQMGADRFLRKPIALPEFVNVINEAIDLSISS